LIVIVARATRSVPDASHDRLFHEVAKLAISAMEPPPVSHIRCHN
jgi:hypothetical protein